MKRANEKKGAPICYAIGFLKLGGGAQLQSQSFTEREKAVALCDGLNKRKGAADGATYRVFEIRLMSEDGDGF